MPSVLGDISYRPTDLPGQPAGRKSIESVIPQIGLPSHAVSLPPKPPKKLQQRDFTDTRQTSRNIYDNVLESLSDIGPISNVRHTLNLSNLRYVDPDDFPIEKQKQAILTGKSLHRRIKGLWTLTDNATGNKLDEKDITVAQVPHLTQRGTFVLNGTEFSLNNQWRLRPGVFTRIKENGEIESHVNVMPGNGISHRYFLDPETGVFKINIGQAKLPLMPVLRAMGVKDSELRNAWGDELVNANLQTPDGKSLNKMYQRLIRRADPQATEEQKGQAISDLMQSMKLDPEVTKRTLGTPHENLSKEAILDTTKKLIAVSKQEAEPDDRDHLAYQLLYGPEDLLAERITKDKKFLRQLLFRISTKGNLAYVQPGVLTKQLHHTILKTGLGAPLEEINPAELLDVQSRVTRLGEGGLKSLESVPEESRSVSQSQLNFVDPVRTAESSKVGIDTRIAGTARKGNDNRIYAPFIDVKTGKTVYKSPQDVADLSIAFPGELEKGLPYVAAQTGGATKYIPREQADLTLPHMEGAFSPLANMIPTKSGLKGQRMSMGARYLAQALPLKAREAPLVQSAMPGRHMDKSFEEHYGSFLGAVHSKQGGTVKKITPNGITVKHDDGTTENYELYNNFPYSRKTFIHNDPLVRQGERVEPNQILAKSNYTDDKGTSALGLNARVAFIGFRGANYEDAAVISDSFAKRLASEHMYQHDQEWNDKIKKGTKTFISLFPSEYTRAQLSQMDKDGVVKPGSVVKYGDPLVLVAEERERAYSQIHRGRKPTYANKTVLWEHHTPGEITDVAPTSKGVTVAVKSYNPMEVGDKISGLYGNKGIVSEIVPDDQMPHDKEGTPFEVALNPLGIVSRINPNQIVVTSLGKIAAKTGQPYKVEDFAHIKDLTEFGRQELARHGIEPTETITDPNTGREIPNVLTGRQYLLKLQHTSESKAQGRSIGGYTQEEIPARGGFGGAKKIGLLETNALLSHGATEFLRDAHLIRGQQNDNYWQSFMSGFRPPEPNVPLIYRKYVDSMKAAGINVVRDGRQLHIMALTDKDINNLAGDREIQNPETVDWKSGLRPRRGGLFDPSLTGGHGGSRFSFIRLAEPLPNPAFEEPIRRILGLTQQKLTDVITGKESVGQFGTGPQALKSALEHINLKKEIQQAEYEVKGSKKTARDEAIRKLQFLKNADRLGLHPKDWILTKVPVLPPIYRPVSVMANTGTQLISDPNYLYKEVFDANQNLKELRDIGVSDIGAERKTLYDAFKGVVGLGEPIQPKNQEKQVKGILKHVLGSGPKWSMMQRQLLGATVDLVGRSVVSPDPDLDMDSVGIPENTAWEVYKPFIIRRLVQKGVPRLEAARALKEQLPMARNAMVEEMSSRPVVLNRAPVLHRYGVIGLWPKLIKGDVIKVPPIVVGGLGMDFNGDSVLSPLFLIKVGDTIWAEGFDRFIATYIVPGYEENLAVDMFGCQTTVFKFEDNGPEVLVPAADKNGKTGWYKASAISIHTSHGPDCFEVATDDGMNATFTAHHNFLSLDENCLLVPVKTEAVKEGDVLPTLFGVDTTVENLVVPQKPINLTFNNGLWLGHYLADGSITGRGDTVSHASTDKVLLELLEDIGKNFSDKRAWYEGNQFSVRWTDIELVKILDIWMDRGCAKKRVASWMFGASREFKIGLVAGYILGEGHNNKKSIIVECVNRQLILGFKAILASLGVYSTVRFGRPAKPNRLETWILTINSYCLADLNIQWPKCKKSEQFTIVKTTKIRKTWDRIPFPKNVSDTCHLRGNSLKGGKGKLLRDSLARKKHAPDNKSIKKAIGFGYCTRAEAERIIAGLGLETLPNTYIQNWINIVRNKTLVWSILKKITKVERPAVTYDLHVEGPETFCIDGFYLTHNTANFHVPVSEEAKKEVMEKMLPSRNLISVKDFRAHYLPSQEYQGGLYHATSAKDDKRPHVFATKADALRAYHEGKIDLKTNVEVVKH